MFFQLAPWIGLEGLTDYGKVERVWWKIWIRKKEGKVDIFFFYRAIFSSGSLEEVILCHTIPSCPLNIYVFPVLLRSTIPSNKGTGRPKKVSTHRRKSTDSRKSEVVHILTSSRSSFSLTCVSMHAHPGTPHMSFELLLSKYCLNSWLCQHIVLVTLLALRGKSEGPRWRGILDIYIWLPINQLGKPQQCCLYTWCNVLVIMTGVC